ncbi:CRISPR-associated helicase Cas3' [Glycomyces sp. L485]|uniref:CRISPR-associated helicase Cas3' n=1 Tax=Glycomyces sp. L485 TaxID=2909235 RepID=UPI001F4B4E93|nr:CRISPR-associated helicase Cas3' [Glycomyces sp. L485]MCH7230520.1 CRISPR-associated helicase Cas3' [Glycomyces sp. L485]
MAEWDAGGLSSAARRCWGKSSFDDDGSWMPLHRHLSDSAAVSRHLYEHFLPASTRDLIAAALPGGRADALTLCAWLAGVHDIGKVSPAFAVQVRDLFTVMEYEGLIARPQVAADRRLAPHATAGMIILDEWIFERYRWQVNRTQQFSVVVGGHHGLPPDDLQYKQALDRPSLLGWSPGDGALWRQTQYELLDWVAESTGAAHRLSAWDHARLSQPVQVLLTGLVIMADWIASNPALFPYREDTAYDSRRIHDALAELDLTAPWNAVGPEPSEFVLTSRFGLPESCRLRPVQREALAAAADMPAPGLMIIEAPMGEGKTEAALLAAETLAARSGAGGCYIALPTQATSDAMFARVLEWARRLPDRQRRRGAHSVSLAHSKAFFNTAYTKLFYRGAPAAIAQDERKDERPAVLIAHWWMAGRKKAMFNSFAVGTIDQLLFGALKAKHLALRHLGLAGKVVIVDEAHAYDVYMGVYLDMALEWLAAYGVPVIILSATLPAGRRRDLMAAYERGRRGPQPAQSRRRGRTQDSTGELIAHLSGDIGYPAVITGGSDGPAMVAVTEPSGRSTSVEVRTLEDDPAILAAVLHDELADGGCALIIRNTVRRVQNTSGYLRKELAGIPVTVAHSRFAAPDRADKDELLRVLFGPSGGGDRPSRHIVVASQVAEQSLDIDFDVLVTDLAPVDLVLQRIGRLHRHHRPERVRPARCYLTGADWTSVPPEPVYGSIWVYGRWSLLRSAAALFPYFQDGAKLELPAQIAPLVQAAYSDIPLGPDQWHESIAAAQAEDLKMQADKRRRAKDFRLQSPQQPGKAILGWLYAGSHLDDEECREGRAMVRDLQADSIEVLLIARDGNRYTTLPWLKRHGGIELPTTTCPEEDLARTVAGTTLNLPIELSGQAVIDELEQRHDWIESWQVSRYLEGQLVLDIDLEQGTEIAGRHLDYDKDEGLQVWTL